MDFVIPNVQTNEKLYNSLEGADENTVKAANGIIGNYFLPHNVGDMSEEQLQEWRKVWFEVPGTGKTYTIFTRLRKQSNLSDS